MTSRKQPKKSPGREPQRGNRHPGGQASDSKKEDCKHRGVAGYGGRENEGSLRSCGVEEDALDAMGIIYNIYHHPVVENGSRNS